MNLKKNIRQTLFWLVQNLPIILWILLLISIVKNLWLFKYFNHLEDNLIWIFLSDILWSLFAWNPINSYILVWEMWNFDNKIILISVFLISWVTVWILQISWEIYFLWKKFSILRNILSFIFAIIWWYLIYFINNFFN